MKQLNDTLIEHTWIYVSEIISGFEKKDIIVVDTVEEFIGEKSIVVFNLSSFFKKPPLEIAKDLGAYLKKNMDIIDSYTCVSGYLNIIFKNSFWLSYAKANIFSTRKKKVPKKKDHILVEYSAPNTNKPLHLGHLRNNFIGAAICNILEENGHTVTRVNLINDRGIHICKSMLAWKLFAHGQTPESTGEKGDQFVGKYYVLFEKAYKEERSALQAEGMTEVEAEKNATLMHQARSMLVLWEKGDRETLKIWEMMNNWVYEGFQTTYSRSNIFFDKNYYESQTYKLGKKIVDEGIKMKVFQHEKDGSISIDFKDDRLGKKSIFRSDGTSLYITQDLGTTEQKFDDFKPDKMIWVVADEQNYHFEVLFEIFKKLKKSYSDNLYHLSYGMVELPEGKMKSREGRVVDADSLMDEIVEKAFKQTMALGKIKDMSTQKIKALSEVIGLGALKFQLLSLQPQKKILYNPESSIDLHGKTGPFIQYSCARIYSLLQKSNISTNKAIKITPSDLQEEEKKLIVSLSLYPEIIIKAGKQLNPSILANYLFDLAKNFNQFYHKKPILTLDNKAILEFRIMLCSKVLEHIKKGMQCLGIDTPERM